MPRVPMMVALAAAFALPSPSSTAAEPPREAPVPAQPEGAAAAPTALPAAPAAQPAPPVAVPSAELRLVGGTGFGLEAAGSLLGDRMRVEGAVRAGWRGVAGESAALVRVLGSAANGLWLRGGFLHHRFDIGCGITDRVTAWDAGLAYRKRWAGGSLFAAEGGFETVSRPGGVYCNDSVLTAQSTGYRLAVSGQYALTRNLGLYGRIGARTGQHVLEIGVMPELMAGVAFEF